MKEREINHLIFASIINLILIGLLVKTSWDGNDKAIILVIFFYPLLILINLIFWFTLSSKQKPESKIYRTTTIGLIILFLPVLILASSN
jgi:RsiW-degrading membrane proteinase PrsW (M82 family)